MNTDNYDEMLYITENLIKSKIMELVDEDDIYEILLESYKLALVNKDFFDIFLTSKLRNRNLKLIDRQKKQEQKQLSCPLCKNPKKKQYDLCYTCNKSSVKRTFYHRGY
jgi:hypothetical protein